MPRRASAVEVTALLPVPAEAVFAFLADLENHWRLAGPFVEVLELDGPPGRRHGGLVLLRGPAGMRRRVRTRVVASARPTEIVGTAAVGGRTRGRVRWRLTARPAGTWVRLSATVEAAGPVDRLLLAAGGRAWLRRRLGATLRRLAEALRAPVLAGEAADAGAASLADRRRVGSASG